MEGEEKKKPNKKQEVNKLEKLQLDIFFNVQLSYTLHLHDVYIAYLCTYMCVSILKVNAKCS